MEIKNFDTEYSLKGAYHHTLTGFKKLWIERNYYLLTKNVCGSVLDIACGDGRMTDYLIHIDKIDGFDLSRQAIIHSQGKGKYRRIWAGDINDKNNYLDEKYDYYICSLSLQYLTDEELQHHFMLMASIMKKTAEYRFSFPNSPNVMSPSNLLLMLRKYYSRIRMESIVGLIPDADNIDLIKLMSEFTNKQYVPVNDSYHYVVSLGV